MKAPAFVRHSLGVRLAVTYALTSALVVCALGLGVYAVTERYLMQQARGELEGLADFYAAYSSATGPDGASLAALAPQIVTFFAPQSHYDVRLFRAQNGRLLASSREMGQLPSTSALRLLAGRRPSLFLPGSHDEPGRLYAARQVADASGQLLAVVEVSRATAEIASFLRTLRYILAGAGAIAVVVALGASILLARQMTRPLAQMEAATQAIAGGDFAERVVVTTDDEIGRLGGAINRMAADLSRLEASRRDFIARISHDLRTPLTALKGLVINLQDRAPNELQPRLATMDEQTDRLARLVDDLLTLSRLQRGALSLRMAPIDIGGLVQGTVSLAHEKAIRYGIEISLCIPGDLPAVRGDADRLQQVIVNLLDNAIRATPAGGNVIVRVSTGALMAGRAEGQPAPESVTVTLLDDGIGLTPEEAQRAFDAYYRGAGGGAGLGLTIAKEIIGAHGGSIWLEPRPSGGAEAGFSIPVSMPSGFGNGEASPTVAVATASETDLPGR